MKDTSLLAAAWQAGFEAACLHILAAANDASKRGTSVALNDLKPVQNPYRSAKP